MPGSGLIIALAAALSAAAGASLLLVFWYICHNMHKGAMERPQRISSGAPTSTIWPSMADKLEGSITKRIKASNNGNIKDLLDSSIKQSSKIANVWRSTYPIKAFKWADHPHLVAEAVEHGWSTFAFTFANMDAPIPLKLWESCTRFSHFPDKLGQPELAWEVNSASSEYMQKIRLNPSLLNSGKRELYLDGLISTVQSLQTTLPLPGPPLGPLSFPQEGYYEITVFGADSNHDSFAELSHTSFNENEHAHLIAPRSSSTHRGYASFDAPGAGITEMTHKRPGSLGVSDLNKPGGSSSVDNSMQVATGTLNLNVDAPELQSATNEQQICAIGFAAGSAPPFRLPGSDIASIGYFSNGRIFMNGKEQKKPEGWRRRIWGPTTAASIPVIVGCGFDPGARRVFFTLNGDMVEEIVVSPMQGAGGSAAQDSTHDRSMEFTANPLFPTIGANYSVMVTANFGQAAFAYTAANTQRVADPCFRRPQYGGGGKAAGEDSADLFSMGLVDGAAGLAGSDDILQQQAFTSPGSCVNVPLRMPPPASASSSGSSSSSVPVIPTSTSTDHHLHGDSDLFEITLDPRTF